MLRWVFVCDLDQLLRLLLAKQLSSMCSHKLKKESVGFEAPARDGVQANLFLHRFSRLAKARKDLAPT